jgi:hypothetical protein
MGCNMFSLCRSERPRIPSVPPQFEQGSSSLFTGSQPGGMRLFAAAMLPPDMSSNLSPHGSLGSSSVEVTEDDVGGNLFYSSETTLSPW